MAKRVTEKDIKEMNEAYLICHSYSGVAAATGWSVSTVRKYIKDDYQSSGAVGELHSTPINIEPATLDDALDYMLNHSNLSCLTEQERRDMKDIWRTLIL